MTFLRTPDVPVLQTRMVYTVNRAAARRARRRCRVSRRIGALGLEFSPGWHEKIDRQEGYFDIEWGAPDAWEDVDPAGPASSCRDALLQDAERDDEHNQDWSAIDFEALAADAIPVTAYKPRGRPARIRRDYTHWGTDDDDVPARDYYRVAWRRMAANTGERTLIPAIIPPGAAHIHGVSRSASAS